MTDLLAVRGLDGTTPEFRSALVAWCADLGIDPNVLTPTIAFETGGTFDPSIPNGAGSGAVGLIQFMPSTAAALGTSTAELAAMSAAEQLYYVAAYLRPYASRIRTPADCYMAVFMPKFVGADPSTVIIDSAAKPKTYSQNRGLDREGKGYITVADAAEGAEGLYEEALALPTISSDGSAPAGQATGAAGIVAAAVVIGGALAAAGVFGKL